MVRLTPKEQELLNAIKQAGYQPGDRIRVASFAETIKCSVNRCHVIATHIRQKELWPYKPQTRERLTKPLTKSKEKQKPKINAGNCAAFLHPVYSGEPNYTKDELEFIRAVCQYQVEMNRKFLLATEYLWIARRLGYRKPEEPKLADCAE